MTFPHLMRVRRLGGNLGGKQAGRSVSSRTWVVCRGLSFMKRVAIAQGNLHRNVRYHRWDSDSTVSTNTPVQNYSRDAEENADYEKLAGAEVLKLWQDINDMSVAAEMSVNRPNQKYFQGRAMCTRDRASPSALRTVPRTMSWRKIVSKFQYDKQQRLRAKNSDSRTVQMTFRERLRTWLRIKDSATRWPQGWV